MAAILGLGLGLAACSTDAGEATPPSGSATDEARPHGYVPGAEEEAEPQNRLVYADAATGDIHALDLLSGETTVFDVDGSPVDALRTDGRYAYASSTATGALTVIDGGSWTVDHGDHKHYYRTTPQVVGALDDAAGAAVASSRTFVAVSGGGHRVLDRAALDAGTIDPVDDLPAEVDAATLVVPAGENLVAVGGPANRDVSVVAPDGSVTPLADSCADPAGHATARTGTVIGCADGALLVTDTSGTLASKKIPYPGSLPAGARATAFEYRPGANYLAARVADQTLLSLDVSKRAWSTVSTEAPIRAVTSPGDGATVLALLADGTLNAFSTEDGSRLTSVPLLPAGDGATSSIQIDTARAYVNDPAARRIHEVDYADGLRATRSFDTTITPDLLVEVGR